MKKTIKESELRNIVTEAVKNMISELSVNEDEAPIRKWDDVYEHTYTIVGMIKSDYNPIRRDFTATNAVDAVNQAMEYFAKYSQYGPKDVDIISLKDNEWR